MELLRIVLTSLGSVVVLFILTKLIGNRQMSQLSMFDYINGITIGSIAAEMATSIQDDYRQPLVAMIVYAVVSVGISIVTCKSIKIRRIVTGKAMILLDDGKIFGENLKKARMDINEFMTLCRNNGYFSLDNIKTAILESNGKISFLPISSQRPVTPTDLQLSPTQEKLVANVILDGHILTENLRHTGNNETWLHKQLHAQGAKDVSEVFLATCDCDNKLTVYVKLKEKNKMDIFD